MAKLSLFVLAASLVLIFVVSGGLAATCKMSFSVYSSTDCSNGNVGTNVFTLDESKCNVISSSGDNESAHVNCTTGAVEIFQNDNKCQTAGTTLGVGCNQFGPGSVKISFGSAARLTNWVSALLALF